jgi:hypothetical protein
MSDEQIFPSIADVGERIGGIIESHMDLAFRKMLGHGPEIVREAGYLRLITGALHAFGNFIFVSNPAVLIDNPGVLDPLLQCPAPTAVLLPRLISERVDSILRSLDFVPHQPMPAMAVDIDRLPAVQWPVGCSFDRVGNDGAEHDAWSRAFAEGYELPIAVANAFAPRVTDLDLAPKAQAQFFAVRKAEKTIATSMLFLEHGLAGLYCVSTIPSERRQGLAACVAVETFRRARNLGYRVGVLQSSPAGYYIYKRLGFADFGNVDLYERMPAL